MDSFDSRRNLVVVSAVTESRPKPCFTIMAVTETKNIANFGAVTETETEFRSVLRTEISRHVEQVLTDNGRTAYLKTYCLRRGFFND